MAPLANSPCLGLTEFLRGFSGEVLRGGFSYGLVEALTVKERLFVYQD